MQEQNEKVIKILEKLEIELVFLENMMICIGINDFELNSKDVIGFSSFLGRVKKDIQKSMEILS